MNGKSSARRGKPRMLLIDLSNSWTKLALAAPDHLLERRLRLPTRELTAARFASETAGWRYDRAVLASVVPARSDAVRTAVRTPLLEVSHRVNLGVGIDFPKPSGIGADRLANAAGVAALYGVPAIVLDFGTALTFDVVSPTGDYVGGVIAPGLEALTRDLHERTALLPTIKLREPASVLGKSTREAMLSGAVIGYRGLVREILSDLRRELGPRRRWRIAATGGYAELIASGISAIDIVDRDLTLHGLRIVAELNPPG